MENKLPKNWIELPLGKVIHSKKGKKPKQTIDFPKNGFDPYILIYEMEGGEVRSYTDDPKVPRASKKDVLLVWDGSIGKCTSGIRGAIGSTIVSITPLGNIPTKFIEYFIKNQKDYILQNSTGTGLQHINKNFFKECIIQLPPISEQNRIIAKLDTLFGQLEQINKSLEHIPTLLKNFRQQVLTQAVTGKLTEEWRKGKELEEWQVLPLIDLILGKPRNGYSPKGVEYITPVKSLSLGATTSGAFDSTKIKYLDIEPPKEDSHLWLKTGDILIQRSNSLDYVGTSAIYTAKDNEFIYPDIMMKIQANSENLNIYLNYALSTSASKVYFQKNASGTAGNMPKINQDIVSNTPINRPPLKEQQEIVNRVENLFAKADAIEAHYEALKIKIEHLPQAILHKAFKGELVPQLESDGDARELLREIEGVKKNKPIMNKKKSATNN